MAVNSQSGDAGRITGELMPESIDDLLDTNLFAYILNPHKHVDGIIRACSEFNGVVIQGGQTKIKPAVIGLIRDYIIKNHEQLGIELDTVPFEDVINYYYPGISPGDKYMLKKLFKAQMSYVPESSTGPERVLSHKLEACLYIFAEQYGLPPTRKKAEPNQTHPMHQQPKQESRQLYQVSNHEPKRRRRSTLGKIFRRITSAFRRESRQSSKSLIESIREQNERLGIEKTIPQPKTAPLQGPDDYYVHSKDAMDYAREVFAHNNLEGARPISRFSHACFTKYNLGPVANPSHSVSWKSFESALQDFIAGYNYHPETNATNLARQSSQNHTGTVSSQEALAGLWVMMQKEGIGDRGALELFKQDCSNFYGMPEINDPSGRVDLENVRAIGQVWIKSYARRIKG